jgi:2'-5' RNA ligase
MSLLGDESTLLIEVPQSEPLVRAYREAHDPVAKLGIPAHITLLYPFRHPSQIDDTLIPELRSLFSQHGSFSYRLAEIRNFPATLWLAPEPSEPFKALTEELVSRYPDAQPYGGGYDEIIPHLSVADRKSTDELAEITIEFRKVASQFLPIESFAEEVTLMTRQDGFWKRTTSFALGAGD